MSAIPFFFHMLQALPVYAHSQPAFPRMQVVSRRSTMSFGQFKELLRLNLTALRREE